MKINIPKVSTEFKNVILLLYSSMNRNNIIDHICSLIISYDCCDSLGGMGGCKTIEQLFYESDYNDKIILNEYKNLVKMGYSCWDFQLITYTVLIETEIYLSL